MSEIHWHDNLAMAFAMARSQGRLLLTEFTGDPGRKAARKLERETYTDGSVAAYVRERLVAVRLLLAEVPEVAREYRVFWTPTLLILDENGTEHYRFEGFLSPEQFLPRLLLGHALAAFHRGDLRVAEEDLVEVAKTHPRSHVAPQALYWLGAVRFHRDGSPDRMLRTWKHLADRYPGDEWALRVSFAFEAEGAGSEPAREKAEVK